MSIQDEINRIRSNISDSYDAIEEMGGTVPDNATSNNLAASVRTIKAGVGLDETLTDPTKAAPADKVGEIRDAMLYVDDNDEDEIEIVEAAEFQELATTVGGKADLALLDEKADLTLLNGKADLTLLGGLKFVSITQEEYDLLGVHDINTVYFIKG